MELCFLIALLIIISNGDVLLALGREADYNDVSFEFLFSNLIFGENHGLIGVPIVRSGAYLNGNFSINLAWSTKEYNKSAIQFHYFSKEQKVTFFNLPLHLELKDITVTLYIVNVACVSYCSNANAIIGKISIMTVKIVDRRTSECIIEIEKSFYAFNERTEVMDLSIGIRRLGNCEHVSVVMVQVFDESAIAGESDAGRRSLIVFEKNDTTKYFNAKTISNNLRSFKVQLVSDNLINAVLGNRTFCHVSIVDTFKNSANFPASPEIVSFQFFNHSVDLMKIIFPPQALVCITSCHSQHHDYSWTKFYCESNGINKYSVNYFWEVKIPGYEHYEKLVENSVFTRVDSMFLDPVYFKPGYMVKCAARSIFNYNQVGTLSISEPFIISNNLNFCGFNHLSSNDVSPISTKLTYLDENNAFYLNRVKIQVEISHQDGFIPLISTAHFNNLNYLMRNELPLSSQHSCSNLIFPSATNAILPEASFLNYQGNSQLFNSSTTSILYRNLDLTNCLWTFTAYFTMGELIERCHGSILSPMSKNNSRNCTIIRLPLYLVNVYKLGNLWTFDTEHHAKIDVAFNYDWQLAMSDEEFKNPIEAIFYIKKISVEKDGRLIIIFLTKPKFNGLFLLHHRENKKIHSRLIFTKYLDFNFNFSLLWSTNTVNKPLQSWKAVSSYTLNDYSGNYILELLPCIFLSIRGSTNFNSSCISLNLKKFEFPIAYEQVRRPDPLIFSLKTYFQVTNSEELFLAVSNDDNLILDNFGIDRTVLFSKGEQVYGKVFWNPGQDLGLAYRLQIETVYLCAYEFDNFTKYSKRDGECLESNLKYRVLLLHRGFEHDDYKFNSIEDLLRSDAKFIDKNKDFPEIKNLSGIDGFIFKVDNLYKLETIFHWFIHVRYIIRPSFKLRKYRSISALVCSSLHNGTLILPLILQLQNDKIFSEPISGSLIIFNLIMIFIALFLIFILNRKYFFFFVGRFWLCNNKGRIGKNSNSASKKLIGCYRTSSCNVTIKRSGSQLIVPERIDITEV